MEQRTILSEIVLASEKTQARGYHIKLLNYRSKFLNYLFPCRKKQVIASVGNTEDIEIVVCCRDTARVILDYDFPSLKLIQLTSTGYDGVPIEQFAERGVSVATVNGVYDVAIAELVLGELLQYYRRVSMNPKRRTPDVFRRYNSFMNELCGKRAILLGTGNIGQCIAARLNGFGVVVDGYNRSGVCPKHFTNIYTEKSELLNELSKYNFVLSTIPMSESTANFCSQEFFEHMNENALFFNVGRKGTVDDNALYHVLKEKRILGAIIDEVELLPFWPFNRFRRLPNTIILPGVATATVECKRRVAERIYHNIEQFIMCGDCDDMVSQRRG